MHSVSLKPSSSSSCSSDPTYRCQLRAINRACANDSSLDPSIQIKARNAVEATRLAHLTTSMAVVEVVRIDD